MRFSLLTLLLLQTLLYSKDIFEIAGQIVAESALFENENGESTNEQDIRRARIAIKGKPTSELKYEVEYSFTGNNDWKDVYLQYEFIPDYLVKVGNIKEPIGLEALSTSKVNTFMERSLTQTFLNKRKLGVQLQHLIKDDDHRYTLTAGAFGKSLDDLIDDEEDGNSVVGRATYAYMPKKNKLLHLGVASAYTNYDEQKLKLNTTPESDFFDRNLVSTKIKNVEDTTTVALETALIWDNFSLQGEYMNMNVKNIDNNYDFESWYVQSSWFITGESRRYKAKKASFSRVKPKHPITEGGIGAWEIALRMSYLDIDDKDEVESKETDYTLGLNWYATSNVRMMANYVRAELTQPASSQEDIGQIRIQYDF
ncbi:MAG: Phosphate-specific outer membrane porin OprP; Pyrophosphate-specific outer membrane porin OprO [uncultured Sulfurovum sp.]|uniref:Phosphate-specific outer membrane porin OprP Pyrophosphate-specific outer membrane porin OprO n=1 Tax=uncultured Sulfurovum sp. TaxID=269237 RepID=A0A6S6TKD7_9BACT|nr:MAG: Phosphate-specific outer membrane porin OprP; Pyrophosphate-specific outer membrane porin OprO [uncultured Sulfurovum sp.]